MKIFAGQRANHFLIFGFTFILASSLSGCSQESKAEQPAKMGPMSVNVVGFKAVKQDLQNKISIIGSLESNESVEIKSEINGAIEEINFTEGARVKAGDVLIRIEKNKLKASYDQALANLKLAETTAQRYENLVKSKAVSQQEYDQAAASLESNRATVELVKEQLEDATITAPFDGVMGERFVSMGQYISQGTRLTYLFNQDPIKIVFRVPERYLGDLKKGQTVKMKVAAYKDKEYEGDVYFIDPKIDETSRTALVKAKVPNPSGQLREGMFASVDLILEVQKDSIVIPESALIVKGDNISVYTVGSEDAVELRTVTTGKRFDGMVEIISGIKEDEVIVTEGYQKIGPGSKVTVRFEDPSERKFYEII